MQINYDGEQIEMDDKLSFKNFTCRPSLPEFDGAKNINVYATCFSQENPNTKVFPDGMTGVTFYNCNLDNVIIPQGNTMVKCWNRKFKVQNDLEDWYLDDNLEPLEPVQKKLFIKYGLSVDPKDLTKKENLPKEKLKQSPLEKAIMEANI